MKLLLAGLAIAAFASPSRADYLEVRRDAVIRANHKTSSAAVQDAKPPLLLALVPIAGTPTDQLDGYYKVTLPGGAVTGWIYRTFVRRFPGAIPSNGSPEVTPVVPSGAPLEVHTINVGQGDAIYIQCPDGTHQLVIDSGDNRYPGSAQEFRSFITSHQATNDPIEVVVASHPDADHIGNMDWLVNNYAIGLYLDDGMPRSTATFGRVEDALSEKAVPHWSAVDDSLPDIDFCPRADVNARVLRPEGFGHDSDPNNNSVVVRVDIGSDSFLFVGDTEAKEEQLLLDDPATHALLDCDFLKVGHHGSATSTSAAFIAAVSPKLASVSCGMPGVSTNSGYKHPRAETLTRLLGVCGPRQGVNLACQAFDTTQSHWLTLTLNKAVYVTSVEGDLLFQSSGNGIQRVITP